MKATWVDNLFARFAAYYGHVWRSQYSDEGFLAFAKKEWQAGLSGFTETVLDKAVLHCRDFNELPPTLPQLISCCRQIRKNLDFYVAEETLPANQAIAREHIQRCKELLNSTTRS